MNAVLQDVHPCQVIVAVVFCSLGVLYLLAQRWQTSGCPFAGSSKPAAPPAGKAAPAATMGSVRLTLAELASFDGSDPSKPLYLAVRGRIYDVSPGRAFYGPGGPYAVFAGKECSRALAFMKVTAEDCSDDLEGASEAQLATLADWEAKFAAN